MMHFFSENRLIFKRATDLGYTDTQQARNQNRASIKKTTTERNAIDAAQRKQREDVAQFNAAAQKNGSPVQRQRLGTTKDVYDGRTPVRVYNSKTGNTMAIGYASQEQKRSAERGRAEGELTARLAEEENSARRGGYFDPISFETYKAAELNNLYTQFGQKDQKNAAFRQERATKSASVRKMSDGPGGAKATGDINVESRPGTSFEQRADERGQMRSQRLGLEAPNKKTPEGGRPAPREEDVPTKTYETHTRVQREASGALQGDGLEGPDSLGGIVDEEMAAIDPVLDAQSRIRDSFKIYKQGAGKLLDQRGLQIEKYKQDGIDRAEQIADAKIEQSKDNRDLELELIENARDRGERDELLAQEKTDRDYDREEDRIIGENNARVERLQTALGARYGGFGSGKGLAKIESARDEGSRVLRELNEDRIHARRESQNAIDDIEQTWREDRKIAFNRHDQTITEAYTKAMEAMQGIDDNALDEDGEKIDKAIGLLKETFDNMEKVWTATGDALSGANTRALDRRDTMRKEQYDKQQDALQNIFSGLSNLPSNSPFFRDLEKKAGLTPGTIASTKSYEERRMAVSEAGLRINQRQLQLQLQEFERDGNKIDTASSKMLGRIVTSTGETFRDVFGNPVQLVGEGGSISSSVSNDSMLYGSSAVGMGTTVNFSNYAQAIGDIVPGSPYHRGGEYDLDGNTGDPIPAYQSGEVTNVGYDEEYGNYVDVYDGVNTTRYAHLQQALVKPGDYINGYSSGNGQVVGFMGNTGNVMGTDGHRPMMGDMQTGSHLHIEMRTGDNFKGGGVIDLMDSGMVPGMMHSGKVTWVDDMRKKMRMGSPIGQNADGSFVNGELDTPWVEIDNQVLEVAKDVFRTPDGGTDWKAVDIVYDYLSQNKMGDYSLYYEGTSPDLAVSQTASKKTATRSAITREIKTRIKNGEEPLDVYESIIGESETLGDIDEGMAVEIMREAGYKIRPQSFFNWWSDSDPL